MSTDCKRKIQGGLSAMILWGGGFIRINEVPHFVRHFLSRPLCPSELGHAPGIKNAPAVGGGTSFILLAVEGGFEPPRGS